MVIVAMLPIQDWPVVAEKPVVLLSQPGIGRDVVVVVVVVHLWPVIGLNIWPKRQMTEEMGHLWPVVAENVCPGRQPVVAVGVVEEELFVLPPPPPPGLSGGGGGGGGVSLEVSTIS